MQPNLHRKEEHIMETKTKVAKPAGPEKNTPETLTEEQLAKVTGGANPLPPGHNPANHNQNVA